ncbi:hypothetical protein ACFL50_03890 [Candidatus Latescibacterota bacterium]
MDTENNGKTGDQTENEQAPEERRGSSSGTSRDETEVDYGRRKFFHDRRSGLERRQSDAPPPGEERRSGSDRRQVLNERRAPIDRRDMAFFDEFDDEKPLGGE